MTDARTRYVRIEPDSVPSPSAKAAEAENNNTDGSTKKNKKEHDPSISMHHGDRFGRYMELKVVKLREQFEAQQLQQPTPVSDIFKGVSIHVNGYTRPSHAELKQLMALHGGRFENYLYRDAVTHIICSNLPDTKIKQLATERKPIPIVRPEWVLASIKAGRLLPITDFQLEPLAAAMPGQRRLFDFKRHEAPQVAPQELYPVLQQQGQQQGERQGQCGGLEEEGQWGEGAGQQQHQGQEEWGRQPQDDIQQDGERDGAAADGEPAPKRRRLQSGPLGYPTDVRSTDVNLGEQQQPQPLQVQDTDGGVPPGQTDARGWAGAASHAAAGHRGTGPMAQTGVPGLGLGPGLASSGPPGMGRGPGPPAPWVPPPVSPPFHAQQNWQQQPHQQVPGPLHGGAHSVAAGPSVGQGSMAQGAVNAVASPGSGAAVGPAVHAGGMVSPGRVAGPPAGASPGPRAGSPHGDGGGDGAAGEDGAAARRAQELAAELRAASDAVKGPPRSTRTDPRFMETFFRSSRLHFIGTWKTRIEALMAEVEARAPQPAPYTKGTERVILHVDMDAFFASAAAVGRPELQGRPLAVCHSNSSRGTGEVSSANYLARAAGVRADMFIAEAKRRCPDLIVVPYEFDKYQAISEQVYRILMSYTSIVQPISCDEAFLDVTGLSAPPITTATGTNPAPAAPVRPDPEALAARLRSDIHTATGCTASAGIGPNLLLARLATKRAKPNGQFRVTKQGALDFLCSLGVDQLPGVGWSTASRLETLGITTVRQVWASSRTLLQKQLGDKAGASLWAHAHGIDERRVEPPKARKSVGAEVNYGIRFETEAEAERFVGDLAAELEARMKAAGVKGRSVTLKVKRRQAGAPEPAKFMGHGACDNLSRSSTLGRFMDSAADIRREALLLLRSLGVPAEEMRGLGLAVSRLDNDPASHTAKPSAPAPARLQAPPRSTFDASKPPPWAVYFQKKNQPQQQQQQQQDGQDATAAGGQQQQQQQQQQSGAAALQSPSPAAPSPQPQPQPQQQLQQGPGSGRLAGVDKMAVAAGEYRRAAPSGRGAGAGRGVGPGSGSGAGAVPGGAAGGSGVGGGSAAAGEGEGAGKADPLPAWYTSRHNDWSPLSAWDEQRAAAAGAAGAGGAGSGAAPRPGARSEQHASVGDAGGTQAGLRKGDQQQQQQQSKACRGLHPLFAALLSGAPPSGVPALAPAAAPGLAAAPAAPPRKAGKAGSTRAPSAGDGVGGASGVGLRQDAAGAMAGAEGSTTPGSKRTAHKAAAVAAAGGQQAAREAAGLSGEHQGPGMAAGVPSTAAAAAEKRPAQGGVAAAGQGRAKPALSGAGAPAMAASAGGSMVECVDLASSDQEEEEQQGLLLEGGAERGAASELGRGMSSAGLGGQEAEVELDVEGGVGLDDEVEVTGEVSAETRGRAGGGGLGAGAAVRQAGGGPGQDVRGGRALSWTGSGANSGGADRGRARLPEGPVAAEEQGARAQRRPAPANSWQSGGEGAGPGHGAPPRPAHSHSLSNANTAATAGPRHSGSAATAAPGLGALRWPPAGLPAAGGGGPRGRGAGKAAARGGRGGGRSSTGGRGQQGTGRGPGGPAGRGSAGLRAEQIDPAVLAELPPDVRREVEREFGLVRPPPAAQQRPAKRSRGGAAPAPEPLPAAAPPRPSAPATTNQNAREGLVPGGPDLPPERTRQDPHRHLEPVHPNVHPDPGGPSGSGAVGPLDVAQHVPIKRPAGQSPGKEPAIVADGAAVAAAAGTLSGGPGPALAAVPTRWEDVDSGVLGELPPELQREIAAALRPGQQQQQPHQQHLQSNGGMRGGPAAVPPGRAAGVDGCAAVAVSGPARHGGGVQRAAGGGGLAAVGHGQLPGQRRAAGVVPHGPVRSGKYQQLQQQRQQEVGSLDGVEVLASLEALPEDATDGERIEAAAVHAFGVKGQLGGRDLEEGRAAFLGGLRAAVALAVCAPNGGKGKEGKEAKGVAGKGESDVDEGREQELVRRVQVTCACMALWLVARCDGDLEGTVLLLRGARRVVEGVKQRGATGRAAAVLVDGVQRAVRAVQQHVLQSMGVELVV